MGVRSVGVKKDKQGGSFSAFCFPVFPLFINFAERMYISEKKYEKTDISSDCPVRNGSLHRM